MRLNIDPSSTPAIWGITDLAPALEIYPNQPFETSDGKTVLPGSVQLGDFRHRVIGTVEDGEAQWPSIIGIYSTEDSLTNQNATYSAFIRVKGRDPIPWLENFRIPVLTQGLVSMSWSRIRVHNGHGRPLRSNDVYTKQGTLDAINAALVGFFTAGMPSGLVTMVDGFALVENVNAHVTSRIFVSSMDPGVTGSLRCEQADVGDEESFVIRSTNQADTGTVAWLVLNN